MAKCDLVQLRQLKAFYWPNGPNCWFVHNLTITLDHSEVLVLWTSIKNLQGMNKSMCQRWLSSGLSQWRVPEGAWSKVSSTWPLTSTWWTRRPSRWCPTESRFNCWFYDDLFFIDKDLKRDKNSGWEMVWEEEADCSSEDCLQSHHQHVQGGYTGH